MEKLNNIKCVIFDNDGTIADTRGLILPSMRYTTKTCLGKVYDDEKYASQVGIPLVDQVAEYTDDPEKQAEMVKVYREYNEAHHDAEIRSFDGCIEALAAMKDSGLTLAVATSKLRTLCSRGLKIIRIDEFMSTVVGAEDTKLHKPHGDPIVFTAEKLGFELCQCAYVGDAPFDMQAAKDAGVTAIGVTWGFFDEETLVKEGVDYICHNFGELTQLFVK